MARENAVKIVGLDQTVKALKAIGTPASVLSQAGVDAANIVANKARTIAPSRTGRLASTIKPAKTQYGAAVRAGNNAVPYANPIHWGWLRDRKTARALASEKGYILRGIKPQPFLANALGYTKEQVLDTYRKQMNKLIAEETAKANGAK